MDTEKGRLIPEENILPEWTARVVEVCAGLQALGSRIDLKIDGKPRGERKKIIDEEVWKLRDNFCRNGKFCPPMEGPTDDQTS